MDPTKLEPQNDEINNEQTDEPNCLWDDEWDNIHGDLILFN